VALHLDRTLNALDYPDQHRRVRAALRHEIDHLDDAAFGGPQRLKDQGVLPVSPLDLASPRRRGLPGGGIQPPLAVPSVAEYRLGTASEANRGRQSQSIEPSLLTRAADCMSPMSA
jgi:hypothetical protein